ncbi:MAG: response regulator [Deltaproteobacteria bacterium]|nr:response regulator [Deltaproteobacteria bacterium]
MEKTYNVLIAEDDPVAREQLAKVIRREGFEVKAAENGKLAFELFEKERPEVIVTDFQMPGYDGLELITRAKQLVPSTQCILMTAFGEVKTAIRAIHAGVLDYIRKPIDLEQLFVALGRAREKLEEGQSAVFYPAVLLAEDDDDARVQMVRVLEGEGWKVFSAQDGEEAVKIFKEQKIDIVLTDLNMPKKRGIEALSEMRKMTEDFESLILTGFGDEANAILALRNGAMGFLKKPIDVEYLLILMNQAVEKLTIRRALKYRTREAELNREVIKSLQEGEGI